MEINRIEYPRHSDFANPGYWDETNEDVRHACGNLVEKVGRNNACKDHLTTGVELKIVKRYPL